jgi:DNA anti-recombination protein RmuC
VSDDGTPMRRTGDSRPVPDPTALTTTALNREIFGLQILLETKINALGAVIDQQLVALRDQLVTLERHRIEQKQDATTALTAALASAKEAVREQNLASGLAINKSEAATTEQLKALTATFQAAIAGVTTELAGVKERVGKIENVKVGIAERRSGISTNVAMVGILVGILVGVATIVITIVART